jgi:hypothetical protein
MVKYIKGKDGKMAGSIGDGKDKVPTSGTPTVVGNPPYQGTSVGNPPYQTTSGGPTLDDLYSNFAAKNAEVAAESAASVEASDIRLDWEEVDEDGGGSLYSDVTSEMYGYLTKVDYDAIDPWHASVGVTIEDGADSDELRYVEFSDRDSAEAWLRAELAPRLAEISNFDKAWSADPEGMRASWESRLDRSAMEREYTKTRGGERSLVVYGGTREGRAEPFFDHYKATVREAFGDEREIHIRTFDTFEQAEAFAIETSLVADDVNWDTMQRNSWIPLND